MRVLVCVTDKQAVLLYRPNVTRWSIVETMKLLKAGLGIFCYFYEGSDTVEYWAQWNYLVFPAMRLLRAMLKK